MRIAYINAEDLSKVGGGRVHFRAVAEGLVNLGNSVYVVAPKYSSKPWVSFGSDKVIGIEIPVPGKNVLGLFYFEWLFFFMLLWFRFKYRWDVLLVRGGGPSVMAWLFFLLGRLLGMRVVLECNGVTWSEFKGRGFSGFFV